jgi:hypothetical protein
MPNYLITYDLPSQHEDAHKPFLTHAEKHDLLYICMSAQKTLWRLPNTTVWGRFVNRAAAVAAFDAALEAAAKQVGHAVKLEKRMVTRLTDAEIKSDKTKRPEAKWKGATDFETCRLHQLHDPFFHQK